MKKDMLLSMAKAAKEIGITRAAVWYAIQKGLLPATKYGPYHLVTLSDALAYKQHRPRMGRPPKGAKRQRGKMLDSA